MTRRIAVTLESRATYGYSRNVMRAMREFPALEPVTVVTGMHLMAEMGNSVDLIRADGFPVSAQVPLAVEGEGNGAWSRAMGGAMVGFADTFEELKPDIVLLSGDRAETLTLCITAAYMGIPIAHIQAGDRSGHIDDAARYAIGKLAHIHLASCDDSAERLRRMGEQEFRIFNVGAPQLDDMVGLDFSASSITVEGQQHDLSQPYILLVQHPVMAERDDVKAQMLSTLQACVDSGLPVYWIYPNSDLGFTEITSLITKQQQTVNVTVFQNLERDDYLRLLANAGALVGNSSSGILEAPTFGVPVVNIGNRQRGRQQAENILNCSYDAKDIAATIERAVTDNDFRQQAKGAINPYGDGKSGPRICEILQSIDLDRKLLDKQNMY